MQIQKHTATRGELAQAIALSQHCDDCGTDAADAARLLDLLDIPSHAAQRVLSLAAGWSIGALFEELAAWEVAR